MYFRINMANKYKNFIKGKYMEETKKQYDQLRIELGILNSEEILTESQDVIYGDGWVKDPFTKE